MSNDQIDSLVRPHIFHFCFAENGNRVIAVDIDYARIDHLTQVELLRWKLVEYGGVYPWASLRSEIFGAM